METFFDKGMAEPEQPEREAPLQRQPLTAEDVRRMMIELVETLSDPAELPYRPDELKKHKAMFPIMAQWLPEREGDALVRQFEAAWSRRGLSLA